MGSAAIFSKNQDSPDEELDYLIDSGQLQDTELNLPSGYISVSQVNTYIRCGMQYYFRYVQGFVEPPAARMVEGSAIHKALEVGQRTRMISGAMAPLDILLGAHHDCWEDKKVDIEVWEEEQPEKLILRRAEKFLKTYHRENMPFLEPKRVESRFWMNVGTHNIPLVGFIDLCAVDTTPRIQKGIKTKIVIPTEQVVDYKVIAKSYVQAEIDNNLQLTTYSSASNVPNVRFDCFVKTKDPKIVMLQSTRTAADIEWAGNVFDGVAEAISAGKFPPALPNDWACTPKWCGYWHRCRGKVRK